MIFICLLRFVNFGWVTPTAHDINYCWPVIFPSSTHRAHRVHWANRPGHTCPTLFEQCAGSLQNLYGVGGGVAKSNRLQMPL